MVPSFEKLNVFQRAYKISLEVHLTTKRFPKDEASFANQIRCASKSICANIAEGFGKQKQSRREFKRFVMIAIGSSDEMRVWSRYCLDLGYIDDATWKRWSEEYQRIAKMLQSLHASIE